MFKFASVRCATFVSTHRATSFLLFCILIGVLILAVSESHEYSCLPGEYLESSRLCLRCRAGYFGLNGSSTRNSCDGFCAAGYYCASGSISPTMNICPKGMYCDIGSAAGIPCPVGTLGSQLGLITCSESCLVVAGRYCGPGAIAEDDLKDCPAGAYCDGTSAVPQLCPAGTFGNTAGATSCSDICPAGFYCPAGSMRGQVCSKGHYCPEGSHSPVPCDSGTYNAIYGSSELKDCIECPSGKFCARGSSDANTNCPAGYYCQAGAKNYTACDAGYYCSDQSYDPRMAVCPEGYYCPTQTGPLAIPCPAGVYSNTIGATDISACIHPCPEYYFCPPGTSKTKLYSQLICPAGYWCGNNTAGQYIPDANGDDTPVPVEEFKCPGGYRNSRTGSNTILTCFCNRTNALNLTDCECPESYYCPAGTTTEEDLLRCPLNHYCPSMTSEPLKCLHRGYYCPRYSTVEKSRTAKVSMSMFSLLSSIANIQNWDESNRIVNMAEVLMEQDDPAIFNHSLSIAQRYVIENQLPLFRFERGLSEIKMNLIAKGLTANWTTISDDRNIHICNVSNNLQVVHTFDQLPVTNPDDDPEISWNSTFIFPRNFPIGGNMVFCMSFLSGIRNVTIFSPEQFSVIAGLDAIRQQKVVLLLIWPLGIVFILCQFRLKLYRRFDFKNMDKLLDFHRFAFYSLLYGSEVAFKIPWWGYVTKTISSSAVFVDIVYLPAIAFCPSDVSNCLPFFHTIIDLFFTPLIGIILYSLIVLFCGPVLKWIDSFYFGAHSDTDPAELNKKHFWRWVRFYVAIPLIHQVFYLPVLAVFVRSFTACEYHDWTEAKPFQFTDQVLWNDFNGDTCWNNRHIAAVILSCVFCAIFIHNAFIYLAVQKPQLDRLPDTCIKSIEGFNFVCKTFLVLVHGMTRISTVPKMGAVFNAGIFTSLLFIHIIHQPIFGAPHAHLLNNLQVATFGISLLGSIFDVAIPEQSFRNSKAMYLLAYGLISFPLFCVLFWINNKRASGSTKQLKSEYLNWMLSPQASINTVIGVTHNYYSPAFTKRLLYSLCSLVKDSDNKEEVVHTFLSLESQCVDQYASTVEVYDDRLKNAVFMQSGLVALQHVAFSKCQLKDDAALRIFKALEFLPCLSSLDLRHNDLTIISLLELCSVLQVHKHILESVNTVGNKFDAFSVSPELYSKVFHSNFELQSFHVSDKMDFSGNVSENGLYLDLEVHTWKDSWLELLLLHLASSKRISLRSITIGGGSSMKTQLASYLLQNQSASIIQTINWTQHFDSDSICINTDSSTIDHGDGKLLIALVQVMKNLRHVTINACLVDKLGGFEFVYDMAHALQRRQDVIETICIDKFVFPNTKQVISPDGRCCNLSKCEITDRECALVGILILENNPTIVEIDLSSNQISDIGLGILNKSIQKLTIQHVNLSKNRINSASALCATLYGPPRCPTNCKTCWICKLVFAPPIKSLDISCNQLGVAGCCILFPQNVCLRFLTQLDISSNRVGNQGAKAIGQCLYNMKSLRILHMERNRIGSLGTEALCKGLKNTQSISELYLDWNEIGDPGSLFIGAMIQSNSTILVLGMESNMIGDEGAIAIAKGLETAEKLKELYLGFNQIQDSGSFGLAKALRINVELETLSLNNNYITDKSIPDWSFTLQSNLDSKLICLDLNHCSIERISILKELEAILNGNSNNEFRSQISSESISMSSRKRRKSSMIIDTQGNRFQI